MTGIIIGTTEVTEPFAFAEYLRAVEAIVDHHGGRLIGAGRGIDVLEGDVPPEAAVVIEFDTVDAARRWYESADYTSARRMRQRSGRSTVVLLDTRA
ncbi:DUF1330 domain-containing protein [Jiangella asiatica]|uniref:DUF1330 domain-containing protein n=1 Tax=Jiangella asiatica TaxID=2530372 RepID=A0A4R5DKQ5_9ACTN|nr:DUF1330 domain-containing protein [Jiangella asiatica]TDE11213.1 DUF1330 domain-containing protein [Jiangella asiatica]